MDNWDNKPNQIIRDHTGKLSVTRFIAFFVIFMMMAVWAALSIKKNEFLPFEWGHIFIILSCIIPKVAQSALEMFGIAGFKMKMEKKDGN